MTTSLGKATLNGFKWSFVNQFGTQFFNLLFSILLARLLSPTEYGLIAMVTVFTGFSAVLIDFGFGNALIYKDDANELDWSTVFWFNLLLGAFICIVLILCAPAIANFNQEPILELLVSFLSINFLFSNASVVYNAKTTKNLDFKRLAIVNAISILSSGIIGICLALSGFGVWSLVWQRISNTVIKLLSFMVLTKWLPTFMFSFQVIKSIFNYSIYLFLSNGLSYWSRNLDNLLIGKNVSSADLGVYSRAYSFLLFPVGAISSIIIRVLFPSFVKIKDDLERVKSIFVRTAKMVALLIFPLMLLFFLCAEEITLIVFGEKWLGIIPFLKLFSFLGMYQSILSLNGPLYTSMGRTKLDFHVSLFTQTVNITALLIGINWGVYGIVSAIYVALVINFFPVNYFILKTIDFTIFQYYKNLGKIFLINMVSFAVVLLLQDYLVVEINSSFIPLLMKTFLFGIIYIMMLKLFNIPELKTLVNLIKSKGKNYE